MEFLNITWILLLLSALLFGKAIKASKLPPGPAPLPILGNLHMISDLPHRSLWSLAHKYGPIMTLYLGSLPTVIISTPKMAKEVLKTQDHIFASRPPMGDDKHFLSPQKVSFSPYSPYWKFMRKIIIQELLSPKRVKSFESIRAQEVYSMVRSIFHHGVTNASNDMNPRAVNVTEEVGFLSNNIICRMSFGKKCNEAELGGRVYMEVLEEVLSHCGGFNYSDFIPLLGRLDLQGNRRKQAKLTKLFHVFMDKIVDEHLERRENGTKMECEDFVDMLLSLSEDDSMEIRITRDHIKNVTYDLVGAATDTSADVLEWAMSELLRNPCVMKKAQEEIDDVIGFNRMVEESDLPHFQYLESVVKETLRLHPPAPLLLPHISLEHSTIEGFHIPKKTQVIVNAWAIARDPTAWEEATEFKPERFLGCKIDVKGQYFELIPFSSGRRLCPGMNLALSVVKLGLARLLHCFNWSLPEGITPENLDMLEAYTLTMPRAKPLHAIPIPRLPLNMFEPEG